MKYKHYNPTNGTHQIYDSKGRAYSLRPREYVYIDEIVEVGGIVCVDKDKQVEEHTEPARVEEKPRMAKKKGDDKQ